MSCGKIYSIYVKISAVTQLIDLIELIDLIGGLFTGVVAPHSLYEPIIC